MKYSNYRFDTIPKRDKYQQTYRHVLPAFVLWADGKKYNNVGLIVGWWKWTVSVFFKLKED